MKNKNFFLITLLIVVISILSLFTQCGHEHVWNDATCITPKTCSECGKTEGEALGHKWLEATCTQPKTCSICGITEGDTLEHTWLEATCSQPKTCSVCGITEGDALEHTWLDATCTQAKTCSVCGITSGEPLGHVIEPATCLTPATCSVCDFVPDNALGDHLCESWDETVEATCTKDGYNKGLCKYCSEEIIEVLPMIAHEFSDWETVKEPTCSKEGLQRHTCQLCGLKEDEAIATVDHELNEWEILSVPENGEEGSKQQTCKFCKEVINTAPYTATEYINDRYYPNGTSGTVSYSNNNLQTAKQGKSGVFAYKSKGGQYNNYYIIDFDEGYVYSFAHGNGDATCDRVKIVSGNLNKVVIITYHDDGMKWSYGLCFKWVNQPDHMILSEEDGYTYDFYATDLKDALRLMLKKKVINY